MIKYIFIIISIFNGPLVYPMARTPESIFEEIKNKNTYPLVYALGNRGNSMGFDVNRVDHDGCTVLHHYAVYGDMPYLLKTLAEKGADFNARNLRDETPFFVAIQNGNIRGAFLLLKFGANPRLATLNGKNCLHLIFQNGELVRLLNKALAYKQENPKKIMEETYRLINCVATAQVPTLRELCAEKFIGTSDKLCTALNKPLPSDIKDFLLLCACKKNYSFAFNFVKQNKNSIFYSWLRTELMYHREKILHEPVNTLDEEGAMPLHYAAANHASLPLIKSLMQHNASAFIMTPTLKCSYQLLDENPCRNFCRNIHEDLAILAAELKRPLDLLKFLNDEINLMILEQKE